MWKQEGKRGIWLNVPITHAAFAAVAAAAGFSIHHASDQDGIVMTKWLPTNSPSPLPHFCHTFVGIGGLVTNSAGHILVVRERFSVIESKPYKLPGGMVDPGEDLTAAVVREVREETGVIARFRSLISVRHAHSVSFGKSDLYFVARLEAESDAISLDPAEIDECRWLSPQEYLNDPTVTAFNKYVCRLALKEDAAATEWGASPVANYNNTGTHLAYHAGSAPSFSNSSS